MESVRIAGALSAGSRPARRVALLAAVAVCALAAPVAAHANTAYVSNATPKAPYNSCAAPAYDTIQAAIDGPTTAIHVCPGTYEEQLQLERSLKIEAPEGATIAVPAAPVKSTTPCDAANEAGEGVTVEDLVSVCGHITAKLKGFHIDAIWPGEPVGGLSCAYKLYGVVAAGGADLEMSTTSVTGAAPQTINGCQYGNGIQIGTYYDPPASAKLTSDSVTGYQKTGISVEGSATTATITKATVTGAGPLAALAQNGIEVVYGGAATINGGTVSGNECANAVCGSDALADTQSGGVLVYEGNSGSVVRGVTMTENDDGVLSDQPSGALVSVVNDTFTHNRYAGVQIDEGDVSVVGSKFTGGEVGIELLQFAGQVVGATGGGNRDTVSGTSKFAVFGRSDDAAGDPAGEFTIEGSKISGNPGPRPQESVASQSPTLRIFAERDS